MPHLECKFGITGIVLTDLTFLTRAPDYTNQVFTANEIPGATGIFAATGAEDRQVKHQTSTQPNQTNTSATTTVQTKSKTKVENNNKSFTCTECGKGLARKDKLVSELLPVVGSYTVL